MLKHLKKNGKLSVFPELLFETGERNTFDMVKQFMEMK
jgi:hypothetical protein